MPPTAALGTRYILAHTKTNADTPDLIRVVATEPNTRVTFTPDNALPAVTLARLGEFITREIHGPVEVTSDHPVLVAQYLVGARFDPARMLSEGDPALSIAVPLDRAQTGYVFSAPWDTPNPIVTVVAPAGTRLDLDGAVRAETPIARIAGHDVFRLSLYPGPHALRAVGNDVPLLGQVSALGYFTSYFAPLGFSLRGGRPPQ
jgi:hypothetical protein